MADIKNMSLNGFFKSNAKSLPDVKVVVSERFTMKMAVLLNGYYILSVLKK